MAEQQVLRMARPAAYWARRAALQHRRGNRRQAEALYQQAVKLTPGNIPLKLAYARVLQESHRYEASNHQAFAALALDPMNASCIGLIGENLTALGYLEEAADAFAHALQTEPEGLADVHAAQLDRLETLLLPPMDCSRRYRVLVQHAAELLAAGNREQAGRVLERACAMPRRDERCHALRSLYYRSQGNLPRAIGEAFTACRMAPRSPRAFCALAELYGEDRQRGQALRALLLAAARVLTADDERLVCQTAVTLGLPAAPLPTLRRAGNRVQSLYNQGVLWLMAGQAQLALQALNRCRALDPEDVPARFLMRTAQALTVLPREQAITYAKGLRLYPELSDADSEACYRAFLEALDDGTDAFALRLQTDDSLYRLFLYQMENPHTELSGLLEQVIPYLEENFTQKLLREILLLPTGGIAEKQLAIRHLKQDGAKPFVLWHGGRLSFVKPHGGHETAEDLRLKDFLLRCGGAGCGAQVMTHALRLIRRMPARIRRRIAAEQSNAFLTAVRMHYEHARQRETEQWSFPGPRHILRLYRMLARVAPVQTARTPQLWLSKTERRRNETD